MARTSNKTLLYIVVPADTAAKSTRLIRGTLKEVESKLSRRRMAPYRSEHAG